MGDWLLRFHKVFCGSMFFVFVLRFLTACGYAYPRKAVDAHAFIDAQSRSDKFCK